MTVAESTRGITYPEFMPDRIDYGKTGYILTVLKKQIIPPDPDNPKNATGTQPYNAPMTLNAHPGNIGHAAFNWLQVIKQLIEKSTI